jgi:hypothetical protein
MLKRIWNSPTITTWLSYSTKAISLFGILPLILKKFPAGDIVLWYLFFTVIALQSLADFGFRQTFSRLISFAYSGADDIGTFGTNAKNSKTETKSEPNVALLNSIVSNMKFIYLWLTLFLFVLMVTLGSWSMLKPIKDSSNPTNSWIGWGILVLISCVSFYGKIYMNFLEGLYKIALVRRIETLTSLGSILSCIAVLTIAPSILNLLIVNQFWLLVVMFRDWYLCKTIDDRLYTRVSIKLPFNKDIFLKIWQPAWRSGISGLMSVGLTNLTGVIYAQIGTTANVAGYLLALRIINQIKEISMAPFYSNIPLYNMLRVKNDLNTLIAKLKRGMLLSHLVFVIGFVGVGLLFNHVLTLLHSHVKFVDQNLWIMLGIAFFVHRFGAMHMQVYLTTNHNVSHIADGVSGVLYIISAIILSKYIGIYSIPTGMLIGYLGFYCWYSTMYSYRSLGVTFLKFELQTSFIPVVIFFAYILAIVVYKNVFSGI